MGLAPQRDFPLDVIGRRAADLGPEAHLYVCAAVMHQLADLLPFDYRAPFSLVAGLERGLTPARRDGAIDPVARLIGSLSRTAIPAEPLPPKTPARPLNPARRTARLTLAIERHETLVISYDTIGRGLLKRHVLEPDRLSRRRKIGGSAPAARRVTDGLQVEDFSDFAARRNCFGDRLEP